MPLRVPRSPHPRRRAVYVGSGGVRVPCPPGLSLSALALPPLRPSVPVLLIGVFFSSLCVLLFVLFCFLARQSSRRTRCLVVGGVLAPVPPADPDEGSQALRRGWDRVRLTLPTPETRRLDPPPPPSEWAPDDSPDHLSGLLRGDYLALDLQCSMSR